ncbi:MAG: endonuclease III [Candidatus Omnitrophica bacterium]|nr:endonuclease III [Candidatus Omnitrophota bacterium]
MQKKKTEEIIRLLQKEYRGAKIALKYGNFLELLVAVILSAQCTDKQVNIVTEKLFKKYRSIDDYAAADVNVFSQDIRSTGFFRNKAKHIVGAAQKIKTEFNGKIPSTMEDLLTLPGVARKTANIVLFNVFGKNEGIAVDTHVRRLSGRLGFTVYDNPEKIEKDLMNILPKSQWGRFSYVLIEHGRKVCLARKPKCKECFLKDLCPSVKKFLTL